MTEAEELHRFAETLHQQVLVDAEVEGQEDLRENQFTRTMIGYLVEAGELEDGHACFLEARGLRVSGYGVDEEEGQLDLFYSHYTQEVPPVTLSRTEVVTAFKRLLAFFHKARAGYFTKLEEASPAFDMAERICSLGARLIRVRLFLFTDCIVHADHRVQVGEPGNYEFTGHIWDLRRLHRLAGSGIRPERIEIDFGRLPGGPPPCLPVPGASSEYAGYLVAMPAQVLHAIYAEHGARLLERNVRAFLQARGKVNKGIRDTLRNTPSRFFAYNNGISATAAEVRVGPGPEGNLCVLWAKDFQVVNGGQTTASVYHSIQRKEAGLSSVYIPAKLSIVQPDKVDELVPLISRFANSQNKVSEPDFEANHQFHVTLERLSRAIWAPAAEGETRQTRWFYERARGQYLDEKSRQLTPARRRAFVELHPPKQRFTKTEVAKFEHTWERRPDLVSRGAEKNFHAFKAAARELPDEGYYRDLIAKAILFRQAERLISAEKLGDYRANIVTYSLAYLSEHHASDFDLGQIWKAQTTSPTHDAAIVEVARWVQATITRPPDGKNVTEWCKKEACWTQIKSLSIDLTEVLRRRSGGRRPGLQGRLPGT